MSLYRIPRVTSPNTTIKLTDTYLKTDYIIQLLSMETKNNNKDIIIRQESELQTF